MGNIMETVINKLKSSEDVFTRKRDIDTKQKYVDAIYNLAYATENLEERARMQSRAAVEQDVVRQMKTDLKNTLKVSLLDVLTDLIYKDIMKN